ncbi:MAG TPA: hypothetical protein VNJ70_17910 [Thermoanaerobaculia bacterium]|nr:hypothetical protein [Thermoanaerobaculia bacterium]
MPHFLALLLLLAVPLAAEEPPTVRAFRGSILPLNEWRLGPEWAKPAALVTETAPAAAAEDPDLPSRMSAALLCSREGSCEPAGAFSIMRKQSKLMPQRFLTVDALVGEDKMGLALLLELFANRGEDSKIPRIFLGPAFAGDFNWTELGGLVAGDEETGEEPRPKRAWEIFGLLSMRF